MKLKCKSKFAPSLRALAWASSSATPAQPPYPAPEPSDVVPPVVAVDRVEGVVVELGEAVDDLVDLFARHQDGPGEEQRLLDCQWSVL